MLKTTISKSEFKAKALEYMRWIQDHNQTVIVTDNGLPAIKIMPHQPKSLKDDLKFFRGTLIKYIRPMDPVGVEDWEALK
jgi:antitoxin (DNA-binding transcriptional repressor) of toxin-antitoxin stability system